MKPRTILFKSDFSKKKWREYEFYEAHCPICGTGIRTKEIVSRISCKLCTAHFEIIG